MTDNTLKYLRQPEAAVLIGSVFLSLIAIAGVVTVGKDAAFYLDIAHEIEQYGFNIAFNRFNWPWISLLIAYSHKLSGLSYEAIAYIYSVLFMGGVSLLIVLIVKQYEERAAWWAVLIVLSVPVFNGFRYEIVRETGFWFFVVFSIYILQSDKPLGWLRGACFQLAVVCAILFRFEASFMLMVGAVYCFLRGENWTEKAVFLLKSTWLCWLGVLVASALLLSADTSKLTRIQQQLSLIDPFSLYFSFVDTSNSFADAALLKWSHSDAPKMLFAGIIFALVYRFLVYTGVVSLVLVNRQARQTFKALLSVFRLNTIAAFVYFSILFAFFVQIKFVNSRYMVLLVLLLLPAIIVAASRFFNSHQKWAKVFLVISVCVAVSNVVSMGDKKTHYIQAAQWICDSTEQGASIYYEDARIQYYAGRGYGVHRVDGIEQLASADKQQFDFFVVEYNKSTTAEYFESLGFAVLQSFSSKKKTIFILQAR